MKELKCMLCSDNKICKKIVKTQKLDSNFESLSPLDDIKEKDKKYFIYKEALDFALQEESVHNIAITGNYGSGKSSVIDSYFKDICCKNFFKISLATFSEKENPDTDIKLIEKGILQQMFYRKPAKAFPFSRFKRIKPYNHFSIIFMEICLLCSIFFASIILKPEWLSNIFKTIENIKYLITFLIASLGFAFVGFYITRFLLKFRLTKFSFQKMEFGLDDVKDESLLNKYIDEILYFFEKTKYKIVVFEDLDRFKNTDVFYHLRELNSLINNYERVKNKVVFIYAVRDDIFNNSREDRTKFFDFIIPIVPVMDSHNSKAFLLENNNLKQIDKEFKIKISQYIDDRRLLKNCINEYQIYDKIIASSNRKILFALIVYKNFYPQNFAELDKRLVDIKRGNIKIDEEKAPLEKFILSDVINESNIKNIYKILAWNNEKNNTDNEFIKLVENKKDIPDFTKKLEDKVYVFEHLQPNKDLWNYYAILNNDILDYLLENKKSDYEVDLGNFINTMVKYDQNHPNKFFTQYQRNKDLSYLYNNINKYILENNTGYDVIFKGNTQKLLQFFLCVDDIDNKKFLNFLKQEINFINETSDFVIQSFIRTKKEQKKVKDFILDYIDNSNIACNIADIAKELIPNNSAVRDFFIKCFDHLQTI